MTDIPGDTSTTVSIAVGGTVSDRLEVAGDRDWIRLDLTAGQTVRISLTGAGNFPLGDTYLRLRDGAGTLIDEDDDSGDGFNSLLTFTATTSGTYFIDVGAFGPQIGTYQLDVSEAQPLTVYTYDQIADQLVNGYWSANGGESRHFNVTAGGSLTVNLTGLTEAGILLAREALAAWSDVTGISFTEVATGGQITFDDNDSGAYSFSNWDSAGFISSSHVNVSTSWLATYGTNLNSYSLQTYIHEIGHALGLGHGGNYNGDADYPTDALYANDCWATTIMSYFSQSENTHFSNQGFTLNFVLTPMIADILAASMMYGTATTTRTGDTTYGFGSNAGRQIFDANLNPNVGYTIFDNGGNDTLDYSGYTSNQLIDLRSETFSNIGTGVGNVSIARGVVIENAIGGSGNDTVIGNTANNVLNGGHGIDTADYSDAAAGVTVNLAITGRGQDTRGAGRDTLSGIENLSGSAFGDTLTGDAGNNVLSDTLGGNDRFIGGAGNDTLSVERSGNGAATAVTLTGGIGDDMMTFDGNGRYTDTVVFEGQDGNDVISATGAFKANVNGGAGNDRVTVDTLGGSFVVKLGSGSDTLILADTDGGFAGSAANIVRDFVAGAGGDVIDLTAYLAGGALTNFTGGSNPFLTGHMRLVQAGADTLVQVDRDGGSNGFVTVLTLQKTLASNFTAYNFNGLAPLPAPVEGGAGADSLTGTSGIDVLNGNGGNDSLVGLAGADVLNGGAGNDVLDGGEGDDLLNGGSGGLGDTATYATASAGVNVNLATLGLQNTGGSGFDSLTGIEHLVGSAFTDELRGDGFNNQLTDTLGGDDFLRGEAGNDTLLVTRSGGGAATTVRLNGGDGDDALTFAGNGRFSDTVTLDGGAGNDLITASGAGTITVEAGAGNDTVIYDTLGGEFRMTLGTGVDTVRLAGTGGLFQANASNLVRDFATGAGGDIVDLTAYLSGGALTNYTPGSNPFADGHMVLLQFGTKTLLLVDRDGGGNGYQLVLAFSNTTAGAFTAANFNGIDPTGAAPMPVQTGDKDADAGPQVWVLETHDKALMPEVLPGAGDEVRDGFWDITPLPGVFGGGADPWVPLTVDEAGDSFLTGPDHLSHDEAGPLVLPRQPGDHSEPGELFTFTRLTRADHVARITGEDDLFFNAAGSGDHGHDGWLF
jgi:serralysin